MATLGISPRSTTTGPRETGEIARQLVAVAASQGTAAIKHVPHNRMVRELIRWHAREAASRLDRAHPPTRRDLEPLAGEILTRLKQPPGYLGWAMVELASGFWGAEVAAVPFDRRLFLVPGSLVADASLDVERHQPAEGDRGALPALAGGSLAGCLAEARRLGYVTLGSESSGEILEAILGGGVDALVGMGTLDDLEKALERLLPAGIPAVALPLLSTRHEEVAFDADWATEMLSARRATTGPRTRSYVHLMRRAKQMFEPRELAELAPRLSPAADWPGPEREPLEPLTGTEQLALDFLSKGGKHSRPFITLAVYDALTGGRGAEANGASHLARLTPAVLRTAMSIETFHKASLVHDDIEDDDAFRYGEETLHRRFGTPTAINVGDYLIGLGYRLVGREAPALGAEAVADILERLSAAHLQLAQGQGAELLWRDAGDKRLSPADAVRIYALKTAPAFEAALFAGARLAGPAEPYRESLARFAYHLGVAFQIENDLGDWDVDRENKVAAGGDVVGGRPTLLWALALARLGEQDRRRLEDLVAGPPADGEALAQVRALYERAGVFAAARQMVAEHAAAAQAVAQAVEPEPLRRLFYYLIEMVLERRPVAAPVAAEGIATDGVSRPV